MVLDPFPFGGGVTSLEAFSLCKPVVTLPNPQTVPRLTEGMYTHMGLGSLLVASLVEEYAALAVRARQDAAWRGEVEASICESSSVLYGNEEVVRE